MLRWGLATKDVMRKSTISAAERMLYPQGIRVVSSWQSGNSSSSSKIKGGSSKRIQKVPSRLALAEKETKKDIRELKAKLATEKKVKETKVAQEAMGELDEKTLEMIYEAINTADPSTPEEMRLEEKRRKRLSDPEDVNASFLETQRGKQVAYRLAQFNARLSQLELPSELNIDVEQGAAGENKVAVLNRESFFLSNISVSKFPAGEDEKTLSSTGAGVGSSEGISLFSDKIGREQLLNKVQYLASIINEGDLSSPLPSGIATKQEWEALAICFAQADEMVKVFSVLEVMEQSGHGIFLMTAINAAADCFAQNGDVGRCQELTLWMTEKGLSPDHYTHHCLVKSFLRSGRLDQALDLISQLEDIQPASLLTYSMTLSHLLHRSGNPSIQSRVWPLFNRMRLVAHPIPDAPCYAIMIRACALGIPQVNEVLWKPGQPNSAKKAEHKHSSADAERGLDLFREMTGRYSLRPDVEVYSALIECCAGREDTYEKAWQLFRNMVEMNKERTGIEGLDMPSIAPNRKIFNSLLTGCRKNGDLLRARWVLAEMLRSATIRWQELMAQEEKGEKVEAWKFRDIEQRRPDQRTMTDIFLAYEKYTPSVKGIRSLAKSESKSEASQSESTVEVQSQNHANTWISNATQDQAQEMDEDTMTYKIPSTKQALLREITSLMERIKIDFQQQGGLLSSVKPSVAMINAYLRALAQHSRSLDVVGQLQQAMLGSAAVKTNDSNERSLFEFFDIEANGWTYTTLLRILSQRGRNDDVLTFAKQVWDKWVAFGGEGHLYLGDPAKATSIGLNDQCISNAWAAMIRILANHLQLDEAMRLLRKFAELYPPAKPFTFQQQDQLNSSSLLSPIRGVDIAQLLQKAPQSPTINFAQLKTLHMRLVESENRDQDISFIKWLVMSYNPIVKMPSVQSTFSTGQREIRRLLNERSQSSREQSYA